MPEYLAPAVYVEEVDTGSKPIEGVSTSTTGFVGVTERGPVNVPILVTSFGEYQRWFGQMLSPTPFGDHRYLPHAVQGFFNNGGKRLFVTRVLEIDQALPASRTLVAPDAGAPLTARLAMAAAPGANSVVLDANPGYAPADTLQIGTGANADFQAIAAVPAISPATLHGLRVPLAANHAAPATVQEVAISDAAPAAQNATTLAFAVAPADRALMLVNPALNPPVAAGDLFRVGAAGDGDELVVAAGPAVGNRVPLTQPLQHAHAAGAAVARQTVGAASGAVALAGGAALIPGATAAQLAAALPVPAGSALRFNDADATRVEWRRVAPLARATLQQGAYADYPAGSRVERVADFTALGAPVLATTLEAASDVGATVIRVAQRQGMAVGQLLRIGAGADTEYAEVLALPGPATGLDPGPVALRSALRRAHAAPATTVDAFAALGAGTLHTLLVLDAAPGDTTLTLANPGFVANSLLRITPPVGGPHYHAMTPVPVALAPVTVPLTQPLGPAQAAGAAVARRQPMLLVRALDAGAWGNRLRVGMEPVEAPLLSTTVRQVLPGGRLRLASAAGVEAGSELQFNTLPAPNRVKVARLDVNNDFLIELDAATPLPGLAVAGTPVRSQEYRFVVELLRQPDPANPARNSTPIDREVFAGLSLDTRHSRYFQRVIGTTWNLASATTTADDSGTPLRRGDRRSEGESAHVRVRDLNPSTALRDGPVFTRTTPPGGVPRLTLLPLAHGDDGLGGLGDTTYVGDDDPDPDQRTGLFTLRNIEEISIVAVPGATSAPVQNALINHCELMRYRFAVLDGVAPPHDAMADIQLQRQRYDTKYAALYHPWVLIPDPYPSTQGTLRDVPIPPSGHMAGIYARTDIERGVHKAPANEVVRGITGLQRVLNKEQHDILNPYPVNINVIRDFRPVNRGIRIYGGRCITSDSDWKYVNVRRLLIFIEASIDRGLQWVVFEPNAEPLWARVRRAITNFLTLVWRNGALEGTKVEEAFFVRCDRTTMTQTDIDQGRLICLVGVAPVKPAEYVIVRIGLWTAHAED